MSDVVICDVFARDGLQAFRTTPAEAPTTADKIETILALDAAGVPEIEITGFAHPKVIPSLADAEQVAAAVTSRPHRASLRALVPNHRGAVRAVDAGVRKLSCLLVASESYQQLNANMSVEQNLDDIARIVDLAAGHGVELCAGVGTSFVCPYEGLLPEARILEIVGRLVDLGITEITLADSVGLAWPTLVRDRCHAVLDRWPDVRLGLHLHTLGGMALANAFVGYEAGVRHFDGSVAGVGAGIAMPVESARLANVATEDLVHLFASCGVHTGIDRGDIIALARRTARLVGSGGGHVTAFDSVDAFVAANGITHATLAARPPGDSGHADTPRPAVDR